jgi:hypothetical protein
VPATIVVIVGTADARAADAAQCLHALLAGFEVAGLRPAAIAIQGAPGVGVRGLRVARDGLGEQSGRERQHGDGAHHDGCLSSGLARPMTQRRGALAVPASNADVACESGGRLPCSHLGSRLEGDAAVGDAAAFVVSSIGQRGADDETVPAAIACIVSF